MYNYAEIIKIEGTNYLASIEYENYIYESHLNGYDTDSYNVFVTILRPEKGYLNSVLYANGNKILWDKKKGDSQLTLGSEVPAVLNDSPFYTPNISSPDESVNTPNFTARGYEDDFLSEASPEELADTESEVDRRMALQDDRIMCLRELIYRTLFSYVTRALDFRSA